MMTVDNVNGPNLTTNQVRIRCTHMCTVCTAYTTLQSYYHDFEVYNCYQSQHKLYIMLIVLYEVLQ